MVIIGLTGSIGMGKSTTAAIFRDVGAPVHDSDATVHAIYEHSAETHLSRDFPQAFTGGCFDRAALAAHVLSNLASLRKLEAIIHPLVAESRSSFLQRQQARGTRVCILDIPLLFETGLESVVDVRLVVTAPPHVQEARVMSRPGMTAEKLASIRARQLDDREKRRRAHWIIDTSHGIRQARSDVRALLRSVCA